VASDSLSVRPEALLQHRDFVAELARGLVQDLAGARAPRSAAWTQPGDPELQLGASLALQQQVVQVVLDLREPFRTVLLLHFYARLSIPKIAERRGDSFEIRSKN
jgi:DNA-directed RNA polymerase specialized sigma24 family protein